MKTILPISFLKKRGKLIKLSRKHVLNNSYFYGWITGYLYKIKRINRTDIEVKCLYTDDPEYNRNWHFNSIVYIIRSEPDEMGLDFL